jgi:hypothetical protein
VRSLVLAISLLAAGPVYALTITSAKIDKGVVLVAGKNATLFSTITWEGVTVGQATKAGKFTFSTTTVPSDCAGTVSDGVATVDAVVKFCGPPGPIGPPGPAGSPGTGLVLVDANGATIGPLVDLTFVAIDGPTGLVGLSFHTSGFDAGVGFGYESSDCSGTRLMEARNEPPRVLNYAGVGYLDGTVYVSPKTGTVTVGSTDYGPTTCSFPSTPVPPDRCCNVGQRTGYGPPITFNVSAFVPPFHAEVR